MIKSLSGRVFLVLLLGIVASVCLTLWLALGERQNSLIKSRESHFLERAEQLVMAIDALPADNRGAFIKMLPRLGIRISLDPDLRGALTSNTANANAMAERIGSEFHVTSLPFVQCPSFGGSGPNAACENFAITLHDGTHLSFVLMPPKMPLPPLTADFYLYLLLFLVCIASLAYLVTRMTIRPLQKLSQAALDLGNDINHPPLEVAGATELKQASSAFNAMQARIRHYIEQRTHMLAAITHDLQTPLTRLRLRIEKVSDHDLRDRLITDLSAMQDMVREGLTLARSMDSSEQRQSVNLDSLIDSAVLDATDAGQPVKLTGETNMSIRAQPQALLRCVNNLIDNALKYGHYANVSVNRDSNNIAMIHIRDGGTGIPEGELEKVFTPFYRLETSRSRDSGGTGLGLTIARNICEQHGGTLTLRNHPEGGLEATLKLPGKALTS
ncbi:ATP-binding protein [Solimicrobium silvestre]|uniref:histidine kinase n=1 Tax=Solimicrobium silvestre TaxID=2099400 RepID=A0A2S9H2H3_9BURK|nr:ATP-binding protein [Solimicrobium silvestre]PRC94179.1 Histidine kinase-, DNA gyrase B-, and HSP90-like ATPase [Solimicrobium silvestre]